LYPIDSRTFVFTALSEDPVSISVDDLGPAGSGTNREANEHFDIDPVINTKLINQRGKIAEQIVG